jgi:hypothetical protein
MGANPPSAAPGTDQEAGSPSATQVPSPAPSGSPTETLTAAAHDATAEWPAKAADLVDSAVALVHDKALRPVFLVARGLVFGLVAGAVGALVAVMVAIGLIRLLDVYAFPGRVWASYALVGFVFATIGLLAWSRRNVAHRTRSN